MNKQSIAPAPAKLRPKKKNASKKPKDSPILQSIFNGIPDAILVIDRNFNIVMFNNAMQKFLHLPKEQIEGSNCYTVCYDTSHACSDCQAQAVLQNMTPPSRIRTCFRDNISRQFEIWNFPIRDENGEVNYIIEYMKDITDRLRMEKELMQAERLAIIGEVAAKTTHEIRNPLNAMEGAAHYLLNEYDDDPKIQKYLGLIKEQISRLDNIASNLLGAAKPRLVMGEKTLINSALLKSIDIVEYIARDKKIEMEIYLDENLPKIRFDEAKIQQVFINILRNACDAIEDSGKIEITGQLRQRTGENFVEISILDNGVGISPEDSGKLFDTFYTTKENGTGLGLGVVKDIMKSHGGYVFIESQKLGTCVSMGLPIR